MLGLFTTATLLSGCGQKGDLYHPTDEDKVRRDKRAD
jgi:predicted small lipoprotein YifL